MPSLRACRLAAAAIALGSAAPAQTLPPGLSRKGDVVMMQPIPDGTADAAPAETLGARPSTLHALSAADHDLYTRAFAAAARGDWAGARALAAQGTSPVARQLLEWRYALDRNSGASFAEIDAVLKATPAAGDAAWPARGTLYVRAEQALDAAAPAPAEILAWFAARAPITGLGIVRLGEAQAATGQAAKGAGLIAQGWAAGSFDPATERDILQKDAAYLTPASDRARLDALLWRGETGAARRQMARVDAATAAVAAARIALTGGLEHARTELAAVADSDDPGLLLDWSRAMRLAGDDAGAHAMLLRVAAAGLVRDHAARWWNECAIQARDALAAGDARTALALAEHAGFSGGDQFAEQQFLAGFIALRALKDPNGALAYFQRLDAAVTRPISKSRAQYWQGRAYEALGDGADAAAAYKRAAAWPETFYGQLALAKTDPTAPLRPTASDVDAAAPAELDDDPLMPQIKVLADLGETGTLRLFVDRDAAVYSSPRHLKRLMAMLAGWGYPDIALHLAKAASYAGAWLPLYDYPLIPLPAYRGSGAGPEPALVLALIRQETEFDPYAVSAAGARGLMQVMPATIRSSARAAGLAYRPDTVMADTDYNIALGMVEFAGHLARFDGSNILAIAAYNGGPNNVRKWLAANGDPRLNADPIDWIEEIPFGETRNYVERVLENMQVYRARLAGGGAPLKILDDLYAPRPAPD